MICTGISANVDFSCNSTENNVGVEEQIVLFRWTDIDQGACEFDATNPLKLKTIVPDASPLVGYSYKSAPNAIRPNVSRIEDGFNRNKYQHNINLPVYGDTADTALQLQRLAGDKVVAVIFTNARTVEVFGFYSGLYVSTQTKDFYENEGRTDLLLANPEGVFEPNLPFFYAGNASPSDDFETLRAEILAYVA